MEKWQEQPRSATPPGRADSADRADRADPAGGELTSVRFAEAARQIGQAAVALGLTAPGFRSPPKRPGIQRSITRRSDGSATVSVAIRGRPAVAVVADMIDGVLAANEPGSTRSPAIRDRLWSAATPCLVDPPGRSNQPRAGHGRYEAAPGGRSRTHPGGSRPVGADGDSRSAERRAA